ncbi:GntR family transcriptional regulator [Alistipes provencensis]|jgi:DNA-binding transcriptional regulator YhcF (GntR family)|uniref:GntR family transcriptional regulator n=1 Tax=Alistipes provencensis TaxID=1816676 RepID=UPI0007EE22D2|nr:GntR family transcriptional regulator [Alistipes provencensis]
MPEKIKIDHESQIPVYKQIVGQVEELVRSGEYPDGCLLPSMNELSAVLDISKETVKKAYSILRNKGYIDAKQGKGFYVSAAGVADKLSVLVLFDKLSNYKQVLFNSFAEEIGDAAEITIRLHNQNVDLLEYYVEENLDLFDYYVITPHFPLDAASQKRVLKILTRIPNRKLIMVDHWMKELPGNYGAVYQDFANDAYEGLGYGLKKLKTCSRFNVVTLPSSLYYTSVGKAVERFCRDNDIAVEFHTEITPGIIREKEVYLILNSQYDLGLIELVRRARELNYRVGRDISIISYNESPINEIILNGLTTISTDFRQMGVLVARMILDKTPAKIKCDFQMIRRNTF